MRLKRGLESSRDLNSVLVEDHFHGEEVTEEFEDFGKLIISKLSLITYFQSKCPLITDLMRLMKIVNESDPNGQLFDCEMIFVTDSPLVKFVNFVQHLFKNGSKDESAVISLALSPRVTFGSTIVMKSLEDHANNKDYLEMYDILNFLLSVNCGHHRRSSVIDQETMSSSLSSLKTAILSKLALEESDVKYILQIADPKTQINLLIDLIDNSEKFKDHLIAVNSITSVLSSISSKIVGFGTSRGGHDYQQELNQNLIEQLKMKSRTISCYAKIAELSGLRSWRDALDHLEETDIVLILKTKKQYQLALEWSSLPRSNNVHISHQSLNQSMSQRQQLMHQSSLDVQSSEDPELEAMKDEMLILAYCEKGSEEELSSIFNHYHHHHRGNHVIKEHFHSMIERILPQITNYAMKQIVVKLVMYSEEDIEKKLYYSDYLLGIKLIKLLPIGSRSHYTSLVSKPSLIIEQMLMNEEFSALEAAVKGLSDEEEEERLPLPKGSKVSGKWPE